MAEEFIEDIIGESSQETDQAALDQLGELEKGSLEASKGQEVGEEQDSEAGQDAGQETAETTKDNEAQEGQEAEESQESVEALAEKLGWNPDHEGPDKVDAATYILRSREIQDTMRDYNKDLKSQVSSLQESIKALQEHNESVYKVEVKKLQADIDRLKEEKREAIELADVDKVTALDEQIDSLQKDLNKPEKTGKGSADTTNPVYDVWVKDNQWYENDDEMANYADAVAEQYKGAPLERVFSIVTQKVKEVFPDKFESAGQETGQETDKKGSDKKSSEKAIGPKSPVEKGSNREAGANFSVNDLSPEQRTIMNQFVRQGIMTEKQYVNDIAKLQEG